MNKGDSVLIVDDVATSGRTLSGLVTLVGTRVQCLRDIRPRIKKRELGRKSHSAVARCGCKDSRPVRTQRRE